MAKSFKSAFDSFTNNQKTIAKSGEPDEVDAFDEETGYNEESELDEDELEAEESDYEEDDYEEDDYEEDPEDPSEYKKLQKQLNDKESYINGLKSEVDKLKYAYEQTQRQLENLNSNQSDQTADEYASLDFDDSYDSSDYGSFEEFEKAQRRKETLIKLKEEAKKAKALEYNLNTRKKTELDYIKAQSDYEEINNYYSELQRNGEDAQLLSHMQSDPLALYFFLKSKKQNNQIGVVADKLKQHKKRNPIPDTNLGKSGGSSRKPKKKNKRVGLHDYMSSNMLKNIESSNELKLIK